MSDEAHETLAAFRRATASSDATRADTWARLQARIAADDRVELEEAPRGLAIPRGVAIAIAAAAVVALAVWAWPWSASVIEEDEGARASAVDGVTSSPVHDAVPRDRIESTPMRVTTSAEPPAPAPVIPPPPPVLRPSAPAAVPPASAAPSSDALAREVALVQSAREAVLRGDLERALERTEAHAREFPRGELAVERWALRIDLLCRLDREPAARTTAIAFVSAHPESSIAAERRRDPCPQKP